MTEDFSGHNSRDEAIDSPATVKYVSLEKASPSTPSRFASLKAIDGTVSCCLESWLDFVDFLELEILGELPRKADYIWRGQRDSKWSISTTLDRLFERLGIVPSTTSTLEDRAKEHLKQFKYAARGRRGVNPAILGENEWWALGQHYGLATPFLDWTRSPFAAAYFAFEELKESSTGHRAIYALDRRAVLLKGFELGEGESYEKGRLPIIEFVEPLYDENQRLVSQGGLFSRAPIGTPIESWVSSAFEGSARPVLIKVEMPDADRLNSLRALDRMNINHTSLFPDLSGASRATNLRLELDPEEPEVQYAIALRAAAKR